jgi:hypothetical protein
MGLAAFSPEMRIRNGLRELNCAESNFAKIAGIVGKTRLIEGLAGENDFDNPTAEKLLAVLNEMKGLQTEIDAPIDWSQVNKIETALLVRRVRKIARELGDSSFDQSAEMVTRRVVNG